MSPFDSTNAAVFAVLPQILPADLTVGLHLVPTQLIPMDGIAVAILVSAGAARAVAQYNPHLLQRTELWTPQYESTTEPVTQG
ncbi:hypothetical protein AcV7_009525 [Taiwanofungus camphoratus]|nr:hypothetical protein AcV7_009525 [Antrodia cinnamomea]